MNDQMNEEEPKNDPENEAAPAPVGESGPVETAAAEPVVIDPHHLRLLEAVLFSSHEPLSETEIGERLPDGAPVAALLATLVEAYANRGVTLVLAGGKWFFRTADDLSEELRVHMKVPRKLSRAAMETLAIVAYHQPITRAEIEEVRGVSLSKGTLDLLLEIGWVRLGPRRKTPGRPVTYRTSDAFLAHFGLEDLKALPGLEELKAAGLLEAVPPAPLMPKPSDAELEEDPPDEGADPEEAVSPAAE